MMFDISLAQVLMLILGICGAVHTIMVATHLPINAPTSIALEVIFSFGAAIGSMHSTVHGDIEGAAGFVLTGMALKGLYLLEARFRKLPTVDFVIEFENKSATKAQSL